MREDERTIHDIRGIDLGPYENLDSVQSDEIRQESDQIGRFFETLEQGFQFVRIEKFSLFDESGLAFDINSVLTFCLVRIGLDEVDEFVDDILAKIKDI